MRTEQIYGEGWLRFAYENPLGRLTRALLVKRWLFSAYYGWRMNMRASARKVIPFIVKYDLDVDEFAKSAFKFPTFNAFFYRALKPESRPIAPGSDVAVFPADGRHLVISNINTADGYYVKGVRFNLTELLGNPKLAENFAAGSMVISRLCPVDYHRFHFPVSGQTAVPKLINGGYNSVSPIALRRNIHFLTQNKRMLTLIDSPEFGSVAMLEIGATNVGTIVQTHIEGRPAKKGAEKGLFKFGGSCVITLFQAGRIQIDRDLLEHGANHVEVFAKMGEHMGCARLASAGAAT